MSAVDSRAATATKALKDVAMVLEQTGGHDFANIVI